MYEINIRNAHVHNLYVACIGSWLFGGADADADVRISLGAVYLVW